MDKERILFVCVHNSARSQMAEAFVEKYAGDKYEVKSAGLTPGEMNPIVVEAMNEIGIDISNKETNGVEEFYDRDEEFDYIITVCDDASAKGCPAFPGSNQIHWGFKDPSGLTGTKEEKLKNTRIIRDEIETRIKEWLNID